MIDDVIKQKPRVVILNKKYDEFKRIRKMGNLF